MPKKEKTQMIKPPHGATLARSLTVALILIGVAEARAAVVSLGTAESYAVLAASGITNTGTTVLTGNVGQSPDSTAPTGFGSVTIVGGTLQVGNTAASIAQADALAAFNTLGGLMTTLDLSGQDLGTMVLSPGIYNFTSTAQLTGTLTLNGAGSYVFKIGSSLTTSVGSAMILTGGALAQDVFFRVGSSATIGGNSVLQGSVIASSSDSLGAGASVQGRVIALNGAVTMIGNVISVPEPSSALLGTIGALGLLRRRR